MRKLAVALLAVALPAVTLGHYYFVRPVANPVPVVGDPVLGAPSTVTQWFCVDAQGRATGPAQATSAAAEPACGVAVAGDGVPRFLEEHVIETRSTSVTTRTRRFEVLGGPTLRVSDAHAQILRGFVTPSEPPPAFGEDDYFAANLDDDCSPATTGSGTLEDPWTNPHYALRTARAWGAGDTLWLRGGEYRVSIPGGSGFSTDTTSQNRADACDDDNADDSGSDGSHATIYLGANTVGADGNPVRIRCYPGEVCVLNGTATEIHEASWTQCAAPNDHTYHLTNSFSSNGTQRLVFRGTAGPGELGEAELRWQSGTISCGGLDAGEYGTASSGNQTFVRLPDGSDPSGRVDLICQVGRCTNPVVANAGAEYVEFSPGEGATFIIRAGYYAALITGDAQHIVFDGVDFVAGGGRDYGYCGRVLNGDFNEFRNGRCSYATGEGIGLYGGGPGGANGSGVNITNNGIVNFDIEFSGRGWQATVLGGAGNSLGMGAILKNCASCYVRDSEIRDGFRSGIQVNTSTECGVETCNGDDVVLERNRVWDYCRQSGGALQTDCGGILIRPDDGTNDNPTITNNFVYGEWSFSVTGGNPYGIYLDGSGGTITGGLINFNTVRGARNAGLALIDATTVTVYGNALDDNGGGSASCNNTSTPQCNVYIDGATSLTWGENLAWAPNSSDVVYRTQAGATETRATFTDIDATANQVDPQYEADIDDPTPGNAALADLIASSCPTEDLFGVARGSTCAPGAVEL